MVKQVEDVHARHEVVTFPNLEVLDQRKVPVLLHGPAERIARSVAVTGGPGRTVGNQRRRAHKIRIQVVIEAVAHRTHGKYLLDRAGGSRSAARHREDLLCQRPADQKTRADAGGPKGAARGAVQDRERQAALISDNAANLPALEKLILEELVLRNWNVVRVTHDQPVRPIKITAGLVSQRQAGVVEDVAATLPTTSRIEFV